jgi:hypothetical protein
MSLKMILIGLWLLSLPLAFAGEEDWSEHISATLSELRENAILVQSSWRPEQAEQLKALMMEGDSTALRAQALLRVRKQQLLVQGVPAAAGKDLALGPESIGFDLSQSPLGSEYRLWRGRYLDTVHLFLKAKLRLILTRRDFLAERSNELVQEARLLGHIDHKLGAHPLSVQVWEQECAARAVPGPQAELRPSSRLQEWVPVTSPSRSWGLRLSALFQGRSGPQVPTFATIVPEVVSAEPRAIPGAALTLQDWIREAQVFAAHDPLEFRKRFVDAPDLQSRTGFDLFWGFFVKRESIPFEKETGDHEIDEILADMKAIAAVFTDLKVLVAEQSGGIDQISQSIDAALDLVKTGVSDLMAAQQYQETTPGCCLFHSINLL